MRTGPPPTAPGRGALARRPDEPGACLLSSRAVDGERLTLRQTELLRAVCREYLLGGEDVGSQALSRDCGWSSATIRNELAALERIGLVERMHRSAGCRPTRGGLEYYVLSMPREAEPRSSHARVVDRSLRPAGSVEQGVRAAVRVLAELGGCVAITFIADPGSRRVSALELVPLSSTRALAVVGFDDGASIVQPVGLDGHATVESLADEALELQTRLRALCIGRALEQAHDELTRLQHELRSHVDRRLAEVVRVGLSVCAGAGLDPLWLSVAGHANLAIDLAIAGSGSGVPPGAAAMRERLAEVLARLEDERRLADILWQLLPASASPGQPHAAVRLGGATLFDPSADPDRDDSGLRLALVGARLAPPHGHEVDVESSAPPSGRLGAVAVIGPDRMDYAAVIPLIEYAARALAVRP